MTLSFSYNYPDVIKAIEEYVAANHNSVVINGKTYTNLYRIGKGGYGIVYGATLGSDDTYVVKIAQMNVGSLESEIAVMKLLNTYSTGCYPTISCYIDDNIASPFFVIPDVGTRPQDKRGPVMGVVLRRTQDSVDYKTVYTNGDIPSTREQKQYFIRQLVTAMISTYALLERLHIAHNDMKPGNLLYDVLPHAPYYKFYVADFGGAIQYVPSTNPTAIKQFPSRFASTSKYDYFSSIKHAHLFMANEAWEVAVTIIQIILECVLDIEWSPDLNFPDTYDTMEDDPPGCVEIVIDLLRDEGLNTFYGFTLDSLRSILLRFVSIADDPANGDGAFAYAMERIDPGLEAFKASSLASLEQIRAEWPTFEPTDEYAREHVTDQIYGRMDRNEIRLYTEHIAQTYKYAISVQSYYMLLETSETVLGSSPSIREDDYDGITALRNKLRDTLIEKIKAIDPTIIPETTIKGLMDQLTRLA